MSDSEEDDFLTAPAARRAGAGGDADMDGGPSGLGSRRRAPPPKKALPEPAMPDFLRAMINDNERKKAAENKVKLQARKEDENDAQVHDLLQRGKDLTAACAWDEEEREPFFLYCPPCEADKDFVLWLREAQLSHDDADTPVASPLDLRDLIRDLGGGAGRRLSAPLSGQTRTALAALAVFHNDGGVRAECRETLSAHLRSDGEAWSALEGVLLRALCDLGYPDERLPPRLRATMQAPSTPRTLVRYKTGERVRLRDTGDSDGRRSSWVKGRILRAKDMGKFEVELEDGTHKTIVLPSAHVQQLPELSTTEWSDEDEGSDDEDYEPAPVPSTAALHLPPFLLLLLPFLQSGAALEAEGGREGGREGERERERERERACGWYRVLLDLLMHSSSSAADARCDLVYIYIYIYIYICIYIYTYTCGIVIYIYI